MECFLNEAVNPLQCIALLLSEKWQHPYSAAFGYVKNWNCCYPSHKALSLGSRVNPAASGMMKKAFINQHHVLQLTLHYALLLANT